MLRLGQISKCVYKIEELRISLLGKERIAIFENDFETCI